MLNIFLEKLDKITKIVMQYGDLLLKGQMDYK